MTASTYARYLFQYAADFCSGTAEQKRITIANHVPTQARWYGFHAHP